MKGTLRARFPALTDGPNRYDLRLQPLEFMDSEHLDPKREALGRELPFFDQRDAEDFLLEMMEDYGNQDVLWEFVEGDFSRFTVDNVEDLDDEELAELLAEAIMEGMLRIVHFDDELPPLRLDKEPEPAPSVLVEAKQTWSAFQVVWDDSDQPVAGLALTLEIAGNFGSGRSVRTTDSDGRVRFETPPTAGEVRCGFQGLTAAECAIFVGIGDAKHALAAPREGAPRMSPKAIIRMEKRKVRSGDTLKSIAREAGLTWQDLALFNFGTKDPAEVADHLEAEVGCTKRVEDGSGFDLSDDDSPGILFVPRQWRQPGMAPVREHKLRVKPAEPLYAHRLTDIRLADDELAPFAEKRFCLEVEGQKLEGRLTRDGRLRVPFPPYARSGKLTIWLEEESDGAPSDEATLVIPVQFEHSARNAQMDDEGVLLRLRNLGYYSGSELSVECAEAVGAIARFQADFDLASTGALDDETKARLRAAYGH